MRIGFAIGLSLVLALVETPAHARPSDAAQVRQTFARFTAALAVPASGIFRGTSALVNLADARPNEQVVRPDVAAHLAFERTLGFFHRHLG